MMREVFLAAAFGTLTGCATFITGPNQDVLIDSNPPGAKATVSGMLSERGPNFIDKEKQVVTTPATVRLRRDNSYRVEVQHEGYKIGEQPGRQRVQLVPVAAGLRSALRGDRRASHLRHEGSVASGPIRRRPPSTSIRSERSGRSARPFALISPEAIMGTSFKLKAKDAGYWDDWTGTGVPRVTTTLEPIS